MHVHVCAVSAVCGRTHSELEGEALRLDVLPCLAACCSLGDEGCEESVCSSMSECDDGGLADFFLPPKACLKELRS